MSRSGWSDPFRFSVSDRARIEKALSEFDVNSLDLFMVRVEATATAWKNIKATLPAEAPKANKDRLKSIQSTAHKLHELLDKDGIVHHLEAAFPNDRITSIDRLLHAMENADPSGVGKKYLTRIKLTARKLRQRLEDDKMCRGYIDHSVFRGGVLSNEILHALNAAVRIAETILEEFPSRSGRRDGDKHTFLALNFIEAFYSAFPGESYPNGLAGYGFVETRGGHDNALKKMLRIILPLVDPDINTPRKAKSAIDRAFSVLRASGS